MSAEQQRSLYADMGSEDGQEGSGAIGRRSGLVRVSRARLRGEDVGTGDEIAIEMQGTQRGGSNPFTGIRDVGVLNEERRRVSGGDGQAEKKRGCCGVECIVM
jgi:hypothetical protein